MSKIDADEKIVSVLFSVAASDGGYFSRSKECILCLTNKRLAVIYQTEMNPKRWKRAVEEQKNAFKKSKDTIRNVYYTIDDLNTDLDLEKNLDIVLTNIIEARIEEKKWAPELKIVFKEPKKHSRSLNFALVSMWIRYPFPDPIEYEKPDWKPFLNKLISYKDTNLL